MNVLDLVADARSKGWYVGVCITRQGADSYACAVVKLARAFDELDLLRDQYDADDCAFSVLCPHPDGGFCGGGQAWELQRHFEAIKGVGSGSPSYYPASSHAYGPGWETSYVDLSETPEEADGSCQAGSESTAELDESIDLFLSEIDLLVQEGIAVVEDAPGPATAEPKTDEQG